MDDDDEATTPLALLLTVPAAQRTTFERLRDMAALKDIELYPSSTDDGLVGFRLVHHGESVHCTDLDALKAQLIAYGVPLLSSEELKQLLQAFQGAFIRGMDDAAGPHGDH